jgi:hypothetical protein
VLLFATLVAIGPLVRTSVAARPRPTPIRLAEAHG